MTPALLLLKDMKEAVIHFEDVITKKQFDVEMDVTNQDLPPVGSLILGYPIHEAEKAEFFMQFTIFPVKRTEELISKVKTYADAAVKNGKTPEDFMKQEFNNVLFALLAEKMNSRSKRRLFKKAALSGQTTWRKKQPRRSKKA